MFIGAEEFFYNILAFRNLWIRGRLGGGKTLLAFAIADELIRRKMTPGGVIANVPHRLPLHDWRTQMPDGTVRGIRDAIIIFDEAWQIIDARNSMANPRNYGAFARKMNTIWIYPSVYPIDRRQSYLYAERVQIYTLPLLGQIWRYRWALNLGYQDAKGGFWFKPEQYFGIFDTKYIPTSDADIRYLWGLTSFEMTGQFDPTTAYKPMVVYENNDHVQMELDI